MVRADAGPRRGCRPPRCRYRPATRSVPVALVQFNLKVPDAIAEHWRREAAAGGFGSVREYLVAATVPKAASPLSPELEQRLSALETAVAALAKDRPPAAPVVAAVAPVAPAQPEPRASGPEPAPAPAGALTTAELARKTASNPKGWSNWAAKFSPGDVRHHPAAGSWRLVGRAPSPAGGPPRLLWLAADQPWP